MFSRSVHQHFMLRVNGGDLQEGQSDPLVTLKSSQIPSSPGTGVVVVTGPVIWVTTGS